MNAFSTTGLRNEPPHISIPRLDNATHDDIEEIKRDRDDLQALINTLRRRNVDLNRPKLCGNYIALVVDLCTTVAGLNDDIEVLQQHAEGIAS